MILNNLKNAIRKKKLYFTIKYSRENVKILADFQKNYAIAGFTVTGTKCRSIFVFVRYCNNFDASITSFRAGLPELSNYQNRVLEQKFNASNFMVVNFVRKNNKPKFCVKFR
jgi:ribosomal protein S8